MSAVKGDIKTKIDAATPDDRLVPGQFDGRTKTMVDIYTADALASGSTIDMCGTLPLNAIVLEVILTTNDLADSTTCSVGDDETPARYITAQNCVTDNQTLKSNVTDGRNYQVDMTTPSTPDNQIVITIGGGTATGIIKLTVLYTHD